MEKFETILIVIMFAILLLSVIRGLVHANAVLQNGSGKRLSIIYNIWLAIKFFFVSGIIVTLISGFIIDSFAEGWVKLLLDVLVFLIASFITYKITIKKVYRKMQNLDNDRCSVEGDDVVPEDNANKDKNKSKSAFIPCPYTGRIVIDTETTVLGMRWPTLSTIFTIKDDWKVESKNSSFGWIDKNGAIHKGIPETNFAGNVNYKATLSGGIIGEIKSGGLYVNGEKVGKLIK